MFRLLIITTLLLLPLQSIASVSYTVRIAAYHNVNALKQELKKLPPALRRTVEIQKKGDLHIASSIQTEDKKTLQRLLPSYQKTFPDAFIFKIVKNRGKHKESQKRTP